MKTKTDELTDVALDWAVNQIEKCCDGPWTPLFSTNWSQGGPIIERERIELANVSADWRAMVDSDGGWVRCYGPTPLIAAMRCFVASRFGDEVEIPEELKSIQTGEGK